MTSRTILITGASGGLGQYVMKNLQNRGYNTIAVGRNEETLKDLGATHHFVADVSTYDGAFGMLERCKEEAGTVPDGLAHLVGSTMVSPLHSTREEQYRECMRSNLDSAIFTLQAYIKNLLQAQKPGAIVLVSSVVAHIGVTNYEIISATKAALEGLVRSTAASYAGEAIRINAVAPGLMKTSSSEKLVAAGDNISSQYPLKRFGSSEDVANAIAWLLSEEADWITGQTLPVDGGFSAFRPIVRF